MTTKTARTPRDLSKVEPYVNPQGSHRCKVTLATGEVVGLHDLTRPELARAARLVFPTLPGNAWLRLDTATVATLVRKGDVTAAAAAIESKNATRKNLIQPSTPPQARHEVEVIETVHDSVVVEVPSPVAPIETEVIEATKAEVITILDQHEAAPANDAEALAAAVRLIAGQVQQPIDLDAIRAEVRATVESAASALDLGAQVREAVEAIGIRRVTIVTPSGEQDLPEQHHQLLPKLIQVLAAGLNVFMPGPAGSGKSTLAHQAAEALGLGFYSVSFGPTTPTSKLFGFVDAAGSYRGTPFRQAYEHGGIFLGDEIDNGHPGLVAELNQALANGYCAFADGMVKRHDGFRMVVTGNTFGRGPDRLFVGRNILDAATLDRFFTLECPVDEALERNVAYSFATDDTKAEIVLWVRRVQAVRRRATDLKLPVVVSPRASIDGARLLACGVPENEVAEGRLFAGIDASTRSKIDA